MRWLICIGARPYLVGEIVAIVLLAQNCGKPAETETGGAGGGTTTTITDGGNGGEAGSGGATGGSGGETMTGGTGGTTVTGGGAGGATGGTGGCAPKPDPCGAAECGDADDGCGTPVTCGTCDNGQACDAGSCCAPKTCADYPGACKAAAEPDGCGGMLACGDAVCGDGAWMNCKSGACACLAAALWDPGNDVPQQGCDVFLPGSTAYYCGAEHSEVPANCVFTGVQVNAENSPWLWCCQ